MAKPIKETPVLTGKDAKRFIEENDRLLVSQHSHAVKAAERDRILKNYNLLKAAESTRHIKS